MSEESFSCRNDPTAPTHEPDGVGLTIVADDGGLVAAVVEDATVVVLPLSTHPANSNAEIETARTPAKVLDIRKL
jgi:hypothetical protein